MRITLIHNPSAGVRTPTRDELIGALRSRGHDVLYQSIEAGDFTHALGVPADIVVACGGDGTVGKVACALLYRDIPLAMVPRGTANNIAGFLGIDWTMEEVAARVGDGSVRRRRLDVGAARGPWGVARFVEAAGLGLVAALLRGAEYDFAHERLATGQTTRDTQNVEHGASLLRRAMEQMRARPRRVEADGDDLSDDYLLVAALNVGRIGPRVELAANADPGDGVLDLVLIREDDRHALGSYLDALADGERPDLHVPVRRVRRLEVGWPSEGGHLDDELWPRNADGKGQDENAVSIEVVGSVEVIG
jgi:diacylglycerol kinase family enzyme